MATASISPTEGRIVALNAGTGKALWQREMSFPSVGGPKANARYIVVGSSDGKTDGR